MIEAVLPAGAVAVDVRGDLAEGAGVRPLVPGEEVLVARAVEKRRRELTAGRSCAHRSLARLGVPDPDRPILAGPNGEPEWPAGVVGSITHCAGYAAAAVAWSGEVRALGIDAEPHERLPVGVEDLVVRPDERALLRRLGDAELGVRWDRVLFSAKEAAYKAWFPQGRRILDFTAAVVNLNRVGALDARLPVPEPGPGVVTGPGGDPVDRFVGRWTIIDGLVLTAAWAIR